MKYLLLFILFFSAVELSAQETLGQVLAKLDTVMAHSDDYVNERAGRIESLRNKLKNTATPEERYWINRSLYDEAMVFDSDSALSYAVENLKMALMSGDRERIAEWRIKHGFVLSAAGLLKEAFDEMQSVDPDDLPGSMKIDYFEKMAYLYSHLWQYDSNSVYSQEYIDKSRAYEDSIIANVAPSHPMYLWYKSWRAQNIDDRRPYIEKLRPVVDSSSLTTRGDAMLAYALGMLYRNNEVADSAAYYFAKAAIADIRSATRDMASLQSLGNIMFDMDDIDRAYNYASYGLNQSVTFNNRVRAFEYSQLENRIGQVYQQKLEAQKRNLTLTAWLVGLLALVLVALAAMLAMRIRKLHRVQRELKTANDSLADHVRQLSEAREELTRANAELRTAHDEAVAVNSALNEANFVKEQCISSMFNICSVYIDKLESFRKEVNRKLLAHQIDDLQKMTSTPTRIKNELRDFFEKFDRIVLEIYPNFVSEFNSLLRDDEAVVVREGELLNTTLRIFALVRLGIGDSVKIAAMLHCSPQTVYNKRMAIRNKAKIPKDEFAGAVRALGKSHNRGS